MEIARLCREGKTAILFIKVLFFSGSDNWICRLWSNDRRCVSCARSLCGKFHLISCVGSYAHAKENRRRKKKTRWWTWIISRSCCCCWNSLVLISLIFVFFLLFSAKNVSILEPGTRTRSNKKSLLAPQTRNIITIKTHDRELSKEQQKNNKKEKKIGERRKEIIRAFKFWQPASERSIKNLNIEKEATQLLSWLPCHAKK